VMHGVDVNPAFVLRKWLKRHDDGSVTAEIATTVQMHGCESWKRIRRKYRGYAISTPCC